MTRFILVRHGETAWTRQRRYQGSSNVPLSPIGKKQVRSLAKKIHRYEADLMYTSTLKRACESGEILLPAVGLKPKKDQRLNEINFGRWEGKTAKELLEGKDRIYEKWLNGSWVTPPGGESMLAFRMRIRDFIHDCRKKHNNKNILVVFHGGAINMFLLEALKLPKRYMFHFHIDPASVTVLNFYYNLNSHSNGNHSRDAAQLAGLNHTYFNERTKTPWLLEK